MRASLVDGIASVVGGSDRGRRVGWSGFSIDRGLAPVMLDISGYTRILPSLNLKSDNKKNNIIIYPYY